MSDRNALLSLLREAGLDDEAQEMVSWWRNAIGASASSSAPARPDRDRVVLSPPAGMDSLVRDFSAPLPSRVQIGPYGERMTQILPASAVARSGAPEQGIGAHDASDAVNQYARTPGLLRDPVTMARMTDIGVGQGVAPGRPQPDAWRVPPEPASFPMQAPPQAPFFAPRPPNESRQYLAGGAFGGPMDANR